MNLALVDLTLDIATLISLALLTVWANAARRGSVGWLIAGVCAAAASHVLLARQEYAPFQPAAFRTEVGGWASALNLARNAGPGLFMVLAHRLFQDNKPVPRWLLALFGLQLLLEVIAYPHGPTPLRASPALLQLLFGGAALLWTVSHWRDDLVEARRRERLIVFVVLAFNMVASSLLLRVVVPGQGVLDYDIHVALTAVALAVLFGLLGRSWTEPPGLRPKPAVAAPAGAVPRAEAEDAAVERELERLIAEEQVHFEPDLTLGELARRVRAPEHRLRRVIHERLGDRNFNAFLHRLRIAEACRRFDDRALRTTPILTVALSVGYNSVNTFNRGFREVTGDTPSAYRAGVLAREAAPDSGKAHHFLDGTGPSEKLESL